MAGGIRSGSSSDCNRTKNTPSEVVYVLSGRLNASHRFADPTNAE
jgi:hypothetical protein